MENAQGGKDEFEVKMEADKEKRADEWKGVFFCFVCFLENIYATRGNWKSVTILGTSSVISPAADAW